MKLEKWFNIQQPPCVICGKELTADEIRAYNFEHKGKYRKYCANCVERILINRITW